MPGENPKTGIDVSVGLLRRMHDPEPNIDMGRTGGHHRARCRCAGRPSDRGQWHHGEECSEQGASHESPEVGTP